MNDHSLRFDDDYDGWAFAVCSCGWQSPCHPLETAAEVWCGHAIDALLMELHPGHRQSTGGAAMSTNEPLDRPPLPQLPTLPVGTLLIHTGRDVDAEVVLSEPGLVLVKYMCDPDPDAPDSDTEALAWINDGWRPGSWGIAWEVLP